MTPRDADPLTVPWDEPELPRRRSRRWLLLVALVVAVAVLAR